ncbi:MAG: type II toxin-antitoxin system HipA family toxin [Hyphomicrobiales bacterium]|nr:type II toxin-antitoxin system HipA family toxin [Hyphomicrobiales bacterium]MCY4048506.1 type II toxin-antitoxin system HipA family toxin [Hyphomicrobiales bacterium]
MEKEIFVYVDLAGAPALVGRLWSRVRNGRESATFEYDQTWLKNPQRFALEPALALTPGPFHTSSGKELFGALGDSAPDSWGRAIMRRNKRRRAERKGETLSSFPEVDFLLLVDDESRQGALRFKTDPEGAFLTTGEQSRIPPLVGLRQLLSAVERVENNTEDDEDLRLLIAPGSSLGGARPKACVRDENGHLALAKFPGQQDDYNVVSWEGVALSLAKKAGIDVPDWRIEQVVGKPVILIRRFDRVKNGRIPFLSAMSMLDARERETRSYLEIADALRQHGAAAKTDLMQLWRRIVFNVLVSNTDDHLRNHGFLYVGDKGWRLSPAYDLNPTPVDVRQRVLRTAIDLDDPTASIDYALETAGYYELKPADAKGVAAEVAWAVSGWREEAARLGIAAREINYMASAFVHEDLEKALRLAPGG